MKKKTLLKQVVTSCLLTWIVFIIGGCEEGGQKMEKWVYSYDKLTITLNLYPIENKFYSTVTGKLPNNSGMPKVLFGNGVWEHYKITGDTMYIIGERNECLPMENDQYGKWLIHQYTNKRLEIEYLGVLPAVPTITRYLFKSKNR